jgi:quinol monooxygenase YgiN
MILMVVKISVKPGWSERRLEDVRELTDATRAEAEMQVD